LAQWQARPQAFDRIILTPYQEDGLSIHWPQTLALLKQQGIDQLGLLGGGQLIASLFAEDLLDFLWLTLCPYWVGGRSAPTPLAGMGLPLHQAQALELLSATTVDQEVFLHYRFWPRNTRV
jgi:riboflavin biosynthesis pyrimidine reductase